MRAPATVRGITLAEVMVAMALGLLLALAMATLHARVLQVSGETTRAADAQDTLRIALAVLEYELQHAGFWGPVDAAGRIEGRRGDATPLAVPVSGDCGTDWAIDLDEALQGWSAGWPLSCAPYGGMPARGAVLVLRRAEARATTPDAGVLQLEADPWQARLSADGGPAAPGTTRHDLVARAYYVSPRSTGDAGRPSLRRKTLQRGPRVVDEELVPGVAAMDLAFGIDLDLPGTPGHGLPNRFTAPELAHGPVVAVRVRLVADDPARFELTRTIPLRNGPLP